MKKEKILYLISLALVFAFTNKSFAQSGCSQCIENSLECDVDVIIDFWCNGQQVTNNAAITITSKNTYCPPWQSFYPNPCNPCDMQVTLVSIGGNAVGAPNSVSLSGPGPVAPDLSLINPNCLNPISFANPASPKLWYDGNIFWILW